MFKLIIILLISTHLLSCSTNDHLPTPILETAFPYEEHEEFFPDIKFQVGYFGNKKGMYGFQIDDKELMIASKDFVTKEITKNNLKLKNCPNVVALIEKLKNSLLDSSKMILGYKPVQETDVIMLDGLFYELYWGGHGSSAITLSGFGIAEYEIPWIKIAEEIKVKALECVAHNTYEPSRSQ